MSEKKEKTLRAESGIEGDDDFLTTTQILKSGSEEPRRQAEQPIPPDEIEKADDSLTATQFFRTGSEEPPSQAEQTLTFSEMEADDDFLTATQFFRSGRRENHAQDEQILAEGGIGESEALSALSQTFKSGTDENLLQAEQKLPDKREARGDRLTLSQLFKSGTSESLDKVNWETGDVIDGKYEVQKILGQGAMGIVYQVYHREWDLDLAVKMPLSHLVANEVSKARFIREAQTWVNLGLHPNIVQCWYVRELGGTPRVFMDYLDGGSLRDWIRKERVKPGEWDKIFDLVIQACDGLGYAHEHGVEAHRDVKPANLLLTQKGDLRVTDFGIAKCQGEIDVEGKIVAVSSDGAAHTVTITGVDLGTPEYGAPEQWGEAKHADIRADIYALGGVLFELCCGRRPFDDGIHREQPGVLIGRHLFTLAPDPRQFNKDVPLELSELILQCLAKTPDGRPNSMAVLREKLVEMYAQVIGAPYKRPVPQAAELRSSTLNNRAVSLLDIGRKEEALAVFGEALKLDPHHAESVYNKSLIEWRAERIADDEVVRRLNEAKQASWRASLYLGFVHVERAAADEAEKELVDALQHYELARDGSVWRALGDMRMAQEKYAEADEAYQKALELLPGDPAILQRRMLAQQRTRQQNGHVVFPWPRCLRSFVGYKQKPDAVTLTSDGRFAILGTGDEMRLWDLSTGKFFWRFTWSDNMSFWTFKGYANSMTPAPHMGRRGRAG
jgi:serine/threonine protein kinase